MSWLWFDFCSERAADAIAGAQAFGDDGRGLGYFSAWARDRPQPTEAAAKIDERAVDRFGGAGWISLARAARGMFLPFDDTAVVHATRMVLSQPPADVFSTLLEGDDRCVGALTGSHGSRDDVTHDPFAFLFPTVVVQVAAGLLGCMPAPVGPVTQRYGADNPWPWDRF